MSHKCNKCKRPMRYETVGWADVTGYGTYKDWVCHPCYEVEREVAFNEAWRGLKWTGIGFIVFAVIMAIVSAIA